MPTLDVIRFVVATGAILIVVGLILRDIDKWWR